MSHDKGYWNLAKVVERHSVQRGFESEVVECCSASWADIIPPRNHSVTVIHPILLEDNEDSFQILHEVDNSRKGYVVFLAVIVGAAFCGSVMESNLELAYVRQSCGAELELLQSANNIGVIIVEEWQYDPSEKARLGPVGEAPRGQGEILESVDEG